MKLMAKQLLVLGGIWVLFGGVYAADEAIHTGVASCSSSTCHGSVSPFPDSNIRQDEFATWQSIDPHSGAYQILLNADSKRIAKNLGIGKAHEATMCLGCHADNVPVAQRGEKFQISDGVGCEACHGGAERWLSSHASGQATHAENISLGLFPTENPVERSKLCLSCHQGDTNHVMTHEIMGAGHPRLAFELDTFTWLNPHYDIDEDYIQRKGELDGVRDWGIGQGAAALGLIEVLLDKETGWNGIFPELVLFDCHACHRSMQGKQWTPRSGTGLGPGVVRFNDASLLMFKHVLSGVDRAAAERITKQTKDLHLATTRGKAETEQAARSLAASLEQALNSMKNKQFTSNDLRAIFKSLLDDGERGQYRDYAAAEQAAMAVDTVLIAFETNGALSGSQLEQVRNRAESLFSATENEESYRQSAFVEALRKLQQSSP